MIDRGVNSFVVNNDGGTRFQIDNLSFSLNMPNKKSIYFTTRPLPDEFKKQNVFPDPWFYQTGVFNGKFVTKIGQGAAGTVMSGEWFGKKAAFKFVDIGTQKLPESIKDGLKSLDEKLSEMTSIQSTIGSKIVSFYGHYR